MTEFIVIDTSSILRIAKDDEDGEAELWAINGKTLIAPESVEWETVNALTQQVYKKHITKIQAEKALMFTILRMRINYLPVNRASAMDIAINRRIMSYDAFVLQCAIEQRLPLLTSEKDVKDRMPYHARELGITLVELKTP